MKLHENTKLFDQAVRYTAEQMGIQSIYIEKDYWVCWALRTIFSHNIGKDVVFKGGTALSKCFRLIERFSEDIDLVAIRRESESDYQMKKKLKTIGKSIKKELPEVPIEDITRKRGMNRKTAHAYKKEFEGTYGQIRDKIILEATWLGYYEPYTTHEINSFIGDMMAGQNQEDLAKEYGMLPFEVSVLQPTRTICEKIMSLVRFSHTPHPVRDLKNKIRHIYDLYRLLNEPELQEFFDSPDFNEMLLKVGEDDVKSFKNDNKWLEHHPKEALIFKNAKNTWQEISKTYRQDFRHLVYGELPKENEMLDVLRKIEKRLNDVNWDIRIDDKY